MVEEAGLFLFVFGLIMSIYIYSECTRTCVGHNNMVRGRCLLEYEKGRIVGYVGEGFNDSTIALSIELLRNSVSEQAKQAAIVDEAQ